MLRLGMQDLELKRRSRMATLAGTTIGGQSIEGTDVVRTTARG